MTVETSAWSGEGEFTALLVEALRGIAGIAFVRVEDAPASRTESGYNFLSNEVYVRFEVRNGVRHHYQRLRESLRRGKWCLTPFRPRVQEPAMSLADLARALEAMTGIGAADYEDERMLQFLRTERIIPPYQTRGIKLVELVRLYEIRPPG